MRRSPSRSPRSAHDADILTIKGHCQTKRPGAAFSAVGLQIGGIGPGAQSARGSNEETGRLPFHIQTLIIHFGLTVPSSAVRCAYSISDAWTSCAHSKGLAVYICRAPASQRSSRNVTVAKAAGDAAHVRFLEYFAASTSSRRSAHIATWRHLYSGKADISRLTFLIARWWQGRGLPAWI